MQGLQTKLLKVDNGAYLENGLPTNTTLTWWPGDTEALYDHNLKTNYKKLKKTGWTKDNISYEFDNYGFRNKENFNTSTYYNLVLGCSHTFGVGVNETDIWYNVLKEKFSEPFYNAAIAGAGIASCYRSLDGLLSIGMKVKRVFILIPSIYRNEIYNDSDKTNCRWDPISAHSRHLVTPILKVKLHKNELFKVYRTSLLAIKYLCQENNIELVDMPADNLSDQPIFEMKDARDLEHPGIIAHKLIGEIFYDEYCNRYGSQS